MRHSLWSLAWFRRALSVAVIVGVVVIGILQSEKPVVLTANAALTDAGPMPDLGGAVAWLNSAPLSRQSLRGKVVLVNFWTYSCINNLRELPYLRSWAAKYTRMPAWLSLDKPDGSIDNNTGRSHRYRRTSHLSSWGASWGYQLTGL